MRPTGIQQDRNLKKDILDESVKSKLPPEKAEDKPSGSGLKPKGDNFVVIFFCLFLYIY
jgi:hypothetical protein